MTPKVTVYVVSHNYGRFARRAIDSVFEQTFRDWELLLINDGSSDDTAQIYDSFAKANGVTVITTEGIGLTAVCQLALTEAKGRYIIRLDADDYLDRHCLQVLVGEMESDPTLAYACPDYHIVDGWDRILNRKMLPSVGRSRDDLQFRPPNGACTLIRVKIIRDAGGYRSELGAQDGLDLFLRCGQESPYSVIDLPLFYYRRHGKNLTSKPYKISEVRKRLLADHLETIEAPSRRTIALVPIRENFDFVKNLWNEKVCGQSLLERSVEVCLQSKFISEVLVVGDLDCADVGFSSYIAGDKSVKYMQRSTLMTKGSDSLTTLLVDIKTKFELEADTEVCIKLINTPHVSSSLIDEAITIKRIAKADRIIGLTEIRHDIHIEQESGWSQINSESLAARVYTDVNAINIFDVETINENGVTGRCIGIPLMDAESTVIRSQSDLDFLGPL